MGEGQNLVLARDNNSAGPSISPSERKSGKRCPASNGAGTCNSTFPLVFALLLFPHHVTGGWAPASTSTQSAFQGKFIAGAESTALFVGLAPTCYNLLSYMLLWREHDFILLPSSAESAHRLKIPYSASYATDCKSAVSSHVIIPITWDLDKA